MKAIILARVSTEEQIKDGQSIPAQLSKARDYVKKKQFDLHNEYQFDESSTKDRRQKFDQVIKEIEKSKEKIALIVETVDRLQRGFKESVLLDELRKQDKVELHFIRENLVIHKNSNSSEIQRWDLAVFLAKSFVLQISDNVRRRIKPQFSRHFLRYNFDNISWAAGYSKKSVNGNSYRFESNAIKLVVIYDYPDIV